MGTDGGHPSIDEWRPSESYLFKKMNSLTFDMNKEHNFSTLKKDEITGSIKRALSDAHHYASSRKFNNVGISLATAPRFEQLCRFYQKENICIFTGAGVSFTESKYYQTSGWWDLLMEIYELIYSSLSGEKLRSRFNELRKQYSRPWSMASYLEKQAGAEKLTEHLQQLLYRRTIKKGHQLRPIAADPDKRLPMAYLNHAATLNAVIAFCSKIRAIRNHPCYLKNEKIAAVLTLNYDCFLEAGATQKHNAGRFKPRVTNETPDRADQLPVYHIHGYIPYGGRKPDHKLILTEQSYKDAYDKNGRAREIIDEFLSKYSTIFIGVSFDDQCLVKRLEHLARVEGAKHHFALLKQGMPEKILKRLITIKVFPIIYSCHEQIPMILQQIYQIGLPDKVDVVIEAKIDNKFIPAGRLELSKDRYWELFLYNKK